MSASLSDLRLPRLSRLRDLAPLIVDQLWFAAAVGLGLILSSWLCTALGLPAPLLMDPGLSL